MAKTRNFEHHVGERVTMEDLADAAGVSRITISRALRDSDLVRPELRERIKLLAKKAGYRMNVSARDLRLMRRRAVAVVVDMLPSDERPLSDPYPLALLGGAAQQLAAAGYAVLLVTGERAASDEIQDSAGVILLGQGAHEDSAHHLQLLGVPLVVWGASTAAHEYVVVGSDNYSGGKSVAQHLIGIGKNHLVFLGDTMHAEIADRFEGFRNTVETSGAELTAHVPCDFTTEAGFRSTTELLESGCKFDGVFACSDLVAVGAINALLRKGLRLPNDVSVVGYDDTPVAATYSPAITTVRQNWHSGGRLLAAKLLDLLGGMQPESETLPTTLVVRAS